MEKQEKKNGRKRVGAILAIVAGVALLAGGSTYALWSASGTVNGGTITAGNLALSAGTAAWWDVSGDRSADETTIIGGSTPLTFATGQTANHGLLNSSQQLLGHAINSISTWNIVPGDTVAMVMPYTITLQGDNLVANLTLDTTSLVNSANMHNSGMSYSYATFDENGNQIGTTQAVSAGSASQSILTIQANGQGQDAGQRVANVPVVNTSGTAVVNVVVLGYFDSATANQTDVNAADTIGSVSATLTQVRK